MVCSEGRACVYDIKGERREMGRHAEAPISISLAFISGYRERELERERERCGEL